MYLIEKKFLEEILNYLGKRPYVEVASLIQRVTQLEQMEEKKEEEPPKKDK